jgi:hypothetical protein
MLVNESIWSRKIYTPSPVAYSDTLFHLGRELALAYEVSSQEPLPKVWFPLLEALSEPGSSDE